jgi:hypothetical protein
VVFHRGWGIGLALGLTVGCGDAPHAPRIGANQVTNGSFELKLSGWWPATDSEGGTIEARSEAADVGALGLALFKGTGGWGAMAGQETAPHTGGQTYQIHARIRGTAGGERVSLSFHGQGFEVEAGRQWQTVERLVYLPEDPDNVTALIANTTDNATVYVDDVSFAPAEVEQGEADTRKDNLVRNGSFESGLGMWSFWSGSGGQGSTSFDARHSGYAGLVLSLSGEGGGASVKQALPEPVRSGEVYRVEAHVRGALGGETVSLCLQLNEEPWDGPCLPFTATSQWVHVSGQVAIEEPFDDQRLGLVLTLFGEGTVQVDDVIVVRVNP